MDISKDVDITYAGKSQKFSLSQVNTLREWVLELPGKICFPIIQEMDKQVRLQIKQEKNNGNEPNDG